MIKKRKWPTRFQWGQFFKVLTRKEKITFTAFFLLFIGSFVFLCLNFYLENTKIVADKGGTHIEGVIGRPRFINPIYANSDADRDLTYLIFSGLMKYDENMNMITDLAERYEVAEEGKVYNFYLSQNLKWQDNTPLTVDDIIFTIETIQNPDFKSPFLVNWIGVKVEKIDESGVKFTLRKPYASFLENCTLGIMPKHIWQSVSPENFAFDSHNLEPIGSGMYKVKKIKKDKANIESITLAVSSLYHKKKPYISEIKFLFFNNQEDLMSAAQKENIKGISLNSYVEIGKNWRNHIISLPRYFATFFNQERSKIFEKKVRLALNYGTNKKDLIRQVLNITEEELINEKIVDSPILPKIYGFNLPTETYEFDIAKAKELLEEAGYKDHNGIREKTINKEPAFKFTSRLSKGSKGKEVTELQKCLAKFPDIYPDGTISGYFGPKTAEAVSRFQEKYTEDILEPYGYTKGTGTVGKSTRAKLNEICFAQPDEIRQLEFTLTTVDQPQMVKTAEILKEQWEALGIKIEIQQVLLFQLEQDIIKPRNYDALLFGEVLSAIPDPFPFWHSSQKKDPGLNLALYESKKADELLEENRKSSDLDIRIEKLNSFQNILIKDVPSIFLFSPDFVYSTSKDIKGINVKKIVDPSKRFSGIENWYIKTKRIWN